MRRLLFSGILLILVGHAFGQSGKLTGKVVNGSSGAGLANATVILVERSKTVIADQDGNFSISKLSPGIYSIKCSYTGYQEKLVSEISIKGDEVVSITVSLQEKKDLETVVISTKSNARKETIASLLSVQKNNASVSDGISAEAIRKTPDRSTSDVLKRVSGASIQDDRFAIIRGLNDRYNAAFLNGAPLPSSESDRKAFAFDIFPSSILDNLVIYKTATPDRSGEFAGGFIDITTKSIPSKGFTSLSFGSSVNSLATGRALYRSAYKGKKDWIGLDDGARALPLGLPTTKEIKSATPVFRNELAKSFGKYQWAILKQNIAPNYNFQFSKGFNIENKGKEFIGALFSTTYSRNHTFTSGVKNSYEFDLTSPATDLVQKGNYVDSLINQETVVALLANVAIRINNKNNLSWKNNFSINSDDRLVKRFGEQDYSADTFSFLKENVRWFTANQIYSSQLSGDHMFTKRKTRINWIASYSKVKREIPNLSRTSYLGRLPDLDNVVASFKSPGTVVQNSGNGTMFSTFSDENIKSFKADIIQPYTLLKNSQNQLKVGSGYQERSRNFNSRCMGFVSAENNFDYSLTLLPEDQIFLPQYLGLMKNGKNGWSMDDGSLSNSDYKASSSVFHAYVMTDQRLFKKLRLIYGLRLERFNQKLNAIKDLRDTIKLDKTVNDFLPSFNLVYSLTSKMNIRLSYARTINRPEFRELAPFIFFDYVSGFTYSGLDTIKRASINNYDFRYEFYPGRAQLISISGFYKEFKDPIEIVTVPNTTNQTTYTNNKSAKVYGVEAEFRTLLSTLFGDQRQEGFLSKFTLSANAAYIRSNVKLGPLGYFTPDQLVTNRALQGQSPYLINSSLGYNDDKHGFSTTVSLNRVGDRVFVGGTVRDADIYEKARTIVDYQLTKYFAEQTVELRFTIRDLLAQKIDFYYDFDKSKSFTDKDRYFNSNLAPTVFSLSATFKF